MAKVVIKLSLIGGLVAIARLGGTLLGATLIDMPLNAVMGCMYDGVNSIPLLAIPFLIPAAELLNSSSVAARIVCLAQTIVGHYRSGLARLNALFRILFAGKFGPSTADVAANSKLLLPAMKLNDCRPEQSVALVTITSTIANRLPSWVLALVYCAIGVVSISGLPIGGSVQGCSWGSASCCVRGFLCRVLSTRHAKATLGKVAIAIRRLFMPLLIQLIMLGDIFSGLATMTEVA